MDQLTAHLDRGWDLAQRGDLAGAQASAQRATELDPESPEAHNLLGYVAAMQGDIEEALEAYEQAIALDDTYIEAMLNAAELYLHPLGEFDEVLGLCAQVLDITEYDDEILDARLLQVEALIGKDDLPQAKAVLGSLPAGPYENAGQTFLVARARYEVGELDAARELLEATVTQDPNHADALYYAGLVREEQGDRQGAVEALLRSRELELAAGMPPWAPNPEALLLLADQALSGLEPTLAQHIHGATVFITALPGAEVIVDGVDPRSIVLIEAVPTTDEPAAEGAKREVRVFVYALNLVKAAGGVHAVAQQLRAALELEIRAVFLGERDPAAADELEPQPSGGQPTS